MVLWSLKKGADKRVRAGHPWVFSNELERSPKGVPAGELVELRDAKGEFLARGYGHPNSLIAFRVLTRDPNNHNPFSTESLSNSLMQSGQLRKKLGMASFSHRLIFGEADSIPGLIVDRFVLSPAGQVFVVQAHTAGVDRALPQLLEAFESYSGADWSKTAVIYKNDVKFRALEGLTLDQPVAMRNPLGLDFDACEISIRAARRSDPVLFNVELLSGQKTGFFLDQASNVRMALEFAETLFSDIPKPIRMLDLCTYVGQWSSQFAYEMRDNLEVTLVDASQRALDLAKQNVERWGAKVSKLKGDVLKDLGQFSDRSFDIVICDPPAFIKNRKEIPQGQHAYMKLNSETARLCKPGALVVTCSCSGLLEDSDFMEVISKGFRRANRQVSWIARGTQAPDHPARMDFPEGKYLKSWIGRVADFNFN